MALPSGVPEAGGVAVTRRYWAGIVGMVVAMIGLTATIIAEHALPEPPKPKQTTINVKVGRFNFGWRSKTQEMAHEAPQPLIDRDRVRLAGTILGSVALPFAMMSWVRRERVWWGLGICSFAIAAIAWQTFVIVFAVLLLSGALFAFVPTGGQSKG